jgi:hypothetical protein
LLLRGHGEAQQKNRTGDEGAPQHCPLF